jgi:hypothetical protein
VEPLDPSALLDHPDLIGAAAPWCTRLDGLELAIVLLCLPWLAGAGLRPADLEHRLAELEAELPVGPIYFQRIRRAVRRLEATGALTGSGAGRSLRYLATPAGLAALVLNLAVPAGDPTIDGSDFELKRALASMAAGIAGALPEAPVAATDPAVPTDNLGRFFERAEQLTVLGAPVLTDERIARAFDVLALIEGQRDRVLALLQAAKARRAPLLLRAGIADALDRLEDAAPDPEALTSSLAAAALRRSLEATVERYRSYLAYLDALARLYAEEPAAPARAGL